MIIVIDGYNLLKQKISNRAITEQERTEFISEMNKYTRIKKHTIIVVFDGGISTWVHKDRSGSVVILYSGTYKTADDVIKQYLEEHKNKDILLVSADNELNGYAVQFDIPSINPLYFYQLVQDAVQDQVVSTVQVEQIEKLTETDNESLDSLMEAFSRSVPIKKDDTSTGASMVNGRKKSKQERKLLEKLKKL